MTITTAVLVVAGIGGAIVLGLETGMDATAIAILVALALVGWLAVEVARRAGRGQAEPARCRECGGLTSPHAPYCKHCGARKPPSTDT